MVRGWGDVWLWKGNSTAAMPHFHVLYLLLVHSLCRKSRTRPSWQELRGKIIIQIASDGERKDTKQSVLMEENRFSSEAEPCGAEPTHPFLNRSAIHYQGCRPRLASAQKRCKFETCSALSLCRHLRTLRTRSPALPSPADQKRHQSGKTLMRRSLCRTRSIKSVTPAQALSEGCQQPRSRSRSRQGD